MPIKNPLLQQAVAELEKQVPKGKEQVYAKIVLAGQKAMYQKETAMYTLQQMNLKGPPERSAGEGAAKLLGILMRQSQMTMPLDVAILAMMSLIMEYLDMMESYGKVEVSPKVIEGSVKAFIVNVMQMLGIDEQKLAVMGDLGRKAQEGRAQSKGVVSKQRFNPGQPGAGAQPMGQQPTMGGQ